jgi:hypothetical protein
MVEVEEPVRGMYRSGVWESQQQPWMEAVERHSKESGRPAK